LAIKSFGICNFISAIYTKSNVISENEILKMPGLNRHHIFPMQHEIKTHYYGQKNQKLHLEKCFLDLKKCFFEKNLKKVCLI